MNVKGCNLANKMNLRWTHIVYETSDSVRTSVSEQIDEKIKKIYLFMKFAKTDDFEKINIETIGRDESTMYSEMIGLFTIGRPVEEKVYFKGKNKIYMSNDVFISYEESSFKIQKRAKTFTEMKIRGKKEKYYDIRSLIEITPVKFETSTIYRCIIDQSLSNLVATPNVEDIEFIAKKFNLDSKEA